MTCNAYLPWAEKGGDIATGSQTDKTHVLTLHADVTDFPQCMHFQNLLRRCPCPPGYCYTVPSYSRSSIKSINASA